MGLNWHATWNELDKRSIFTTEKRYDDLGFYLFLFHLFRREIRSWGEFIYFFLFCIFLIRIVIFYIQLSHLLSIREMICHNFLYELIRGLVEYYLLCIVSRKNILKIRFSHDTFFLWICLLLISRYLWFGVLICALKILVEFD